MQEILAIAPNRTAFAPFLELGTWTFHITWHPICIGMLEPKLRNARGVLTLASTSTSKTSGVYVLPSMWDALSASDISFIQKAIPDGGISTTDTVCSARMKLTKIGLHLFDPRV